jgi:cation diffusion facilitator CzcD-associated flavoprotein CzcO
MARIVIVGAGPIGLWTALQIKDKLPEEEITILEKNELYERRHHLRIEASSVPSVSPDSKIYDIVSFLKETRSPRTNDLRTAPCRKMQK